MVSSQGAEAALDRLMPNRLPQKIGGIALTHLLNEQGRIEIELTVIKTGEDAYYLVCAAFFELGVAWIIWPTLPRGDCGRSSDG